MNNNYLGTISMAKRASKIVIGADVTYEALEESYARLVLLASDCSKKSVKSVEVLAEALNIPVLTLPCDKEELGRELGKASVGIMAITDTGFASAIGKKLSQISTEYTETSEKLDLKLKRKLEREERKKDPTQARPKKEKQDYHFNGDKNAKSDRKPRFDGDKPKQYGDRKPRFDGDKPKQYGDKKPRFDGDKPKQYGKSNYNDKKSYGDKKAKNYSNKDNNTKSDGSSSFKYNDTPPKNAVKWSKFKK